MTAQDKAGTSVSVKSKGKLKEKHLLYISAGCTQEGQKLSVMLNSWHNVKQRLGRESMSYDPENRKNWVF